MIKTPLFGLETFQKCQQSQGSGGRGRETQNFESFRLLSSRLKSAACRHSLFNGSNTRSTTPGLLQLQLTMGGVTPHTHTTLSRPHGAIVCPHRAIMPRAGGWAFEHSEPTSAATVQLGNTTRADTGSQAAHGTGMLWMCEVFGACTVRAGIPWARVLCLRLKSVDS